MYKFTPCRDGGGDIESWLVCRRDAPQRYQVGFEKRHNDARWVEPRQTFTANQKIHKTIQKKQGCGKWLMNTGPRHSSLLRPWIRRGVTDRGELVRFAAETPTKMVISEALRLPTILAENGQKLQSCVQFMSRSSTLARAKHLGRQHFSPRNSIHSSPASYRTTKQSRPGGLDPPRRGTTNCRACLTVG